jgi:hypothetical protein
MIDDPTEKLFLHHEEFGDRVLGFLAGYLIYAKLVPEGPNAIAIIEKLGGRTLGADGRELVAVVLDQQIQR